MNLLEMRWYYKLIGFDIAVEIVFDVVFEVEVVFSPPPFR